MQQERQSWYQKSWFIILTLLFIFPLGLFLMWRYAHWKIWLKLVVSSVYTIGLVLTVLFQVSLLNENKPNQTEHASTMKEKSDINNVKTTRNKNIEKSIHKDKQNSVNLKQNTKDQNNNANDEVASPTSEQNAAIAQAKSYANSLPISKKSLYKQLTSEYGEKYPADVAQYAVDHISVDYKMNALRLAKSYVKNINISNQALYDQLVSENGEGFTPEEAQYAINHLDR